MKLREKIIELGNEVVKIGSGNSFWYLGEINEKTFSKINAQSNYFLNKLKNQQKKVKYHLKNFDKIWENLVKTREKKLRKMYKESKKNFTKKRYEKFLKEQQERKIKDKKVNEERILKLTNQINNWIPLLERKVRKVYPAETEKATIIIVQGKEQGNWWTIKEKETKGKVV